MSKVYYFAYGSLMDLDFVNDLGVRYYNAEKGILKEFQFQTSVQDGEDPNYGYANIVRQENNKVEGVLMLIDEKQIQYLDHYEGYPDLYTREKLTIEDSSGTKKKAWVYLGVSIHCVKHNLNLTSVQKQRIRNGFSFLSESYTEELENIISKN